MAKVPFRSKGNWTEKPEGSPELFCCSELRQTPFSKLVSPDQHTSLFCLLFLASPHSSVCLFTLTLASPSACPVLFCTSLLPGDRPTKNSPHSLSRPQLPREQEMRGGWEACALPSPTDSQLRTVSSTPVWGSANLAISGASHTPSLEGKACS